MKNPVSSAAVSINQLVTKRGLAWLMLDHQAQCRVFPKILSYLRRRCVDSGDGPRIHVIQRNPGSYLIDNR
jgi:hypothetical protein